MELTRRSFLGTSAAVVAGSLASGKVFGANDKVRMCVIGLRGRGSSHYNAWTDLEDSEVVALCDVDERFLNAAAKAVEDKSGKKPKLYTDMRDAFADDEVDAVSIATPNHWHTLATVWACQAGKDVYVEKPATHNIYEGQQIVAAAKMHDRVVMHGTQNRSNATWIRDIGLLQSGEIIGPLYMARGLGYKNGNRGSLGFAEDSDPPAELNWDIWQGPASRKPFNRLYHPYTWHWFWHYGNGEIGNQGVHQMDVGLWGMNRGLPVKTYSMGGRYTYEDQGETPNTNVATFTYADGTSFVFEVRNRFTNSEGGTMLDGEYKPGVSVGNLFYADEGYYVENQGFFDTQNKFIPVDDEKYPKPETLGNWGNFLRAVKTRKPEDNFAPVHEAARSSAHCHLANISYRLGRTVEFDQETMRFKDEEANSMLSREYAPGFEVPKLA